MLYGRSVPVQTFASPLAVLLVTQRCRSLSATNSSRFRFCGAGKGTIGIDLPSLVAVPIPRKYGPRAPDAQATLRRVLPAIVVLRFDLRSLPALAPVRHRRLAEPRLRCTATQSQEVGRGTSTVQLQL